MSRLSWKWSERPPLRSRIERVKKQRKHYTAEEKAAIVRRRLVENVAVADLCEELGLQPTAFYRGKRNF
jgi:transposase-like protein